MFLCFLYSFFLFILFLSFFLPLFFFLFFFFFFFRGALALSLSSLLGDPHQQAPLQRRKSSSPKEEIFLFNDSVGKWNSLSSFLVADTRLYTLPCRSVGPSVRRSVRNISELRAVFALPLLPNRPRLNCRVSGLVHSGVSVRCILLIFVSEVDLMALWFVILSTK